MTNSTQHLDAAVECVLREGRATPAILRRTLGVGRAEAGRLMVHLEWLGIVGRSGELLVTRKEWERVISEGDSPARRATA